MWAIKLTLAGILFWIFFQDYKDRLVYWFLYPAIGLCAFIIQVYKINFIGAIVNAIANMIFVSVLLTICYVYVRFRMRMPFKDAIGLGDILLFVFLAFTFSILCFFVFFVFSLLFALIMHLFVKKHDPDKTVPLAGYMSLFFSIIYCISFFVPDNFLYSY